MKCYLFIFLIISTVLHNELYSQSKKSCKGSPPGEIICEKDQIAWCDNNDNFVKGGCNSIDESLYGKDLLREIISGIEESSGRTFDWSKFSNSEIIGNLKKGKIEFGENWATKNVIYISLPHDLRNKL